MMSCCLAWCLLYYPGWLWKTAICGYQPRISSHQEQRWYLNYSLINIAFSTFTRLFPLWTISSYCVTYGFVNCDDPLFQCRNAHFFQKFSKFSINVLRQLKCDWNVLIWNDHKQWFTCAGLSSVLAKLLSTGTALYNTRPCVYPSSELLIQLNNSHLPHTTASILVCQNVDILGYLLFLTSQNILICPHSKLNLLG